MVSQQQIDIIIKAEDRASKIIEKVETQLNNVRSLSNGLNSTFNTASNGANRLGNSLMKINPYQLRRVQEISLLLQQALLYVANNIRAVQNAMGRINGSNFKQIESNVKQLDTTLTATKGSANQLDRALDTIDVRAISVADAETNKFKEKLQSIIPTAQEVKTALSGIGNVNLGGVTDKLSGLKEKIQGVGSSTTYATNGLTNLNTGSRLAGASLGFLRNAASMTVGMIGYDLFNSVMESGRAAINASSQIEYFGNRLGMSGTEVATFKGKLNELQGQFRKVNMNAVGAAAEELAVKLGLGKDAVVDLTQVTATMSSAFIKEGRTQTDAILAVSDALDGQFRRLQELGISQEMLVKNGWNGDLEDKNSLLQAMNKTLDEMGFTQTAKDITSLDDAYQALTVSGGLLMEKILVPITPLLMQMAEAAMSACDWIMGAIDGLTSSWNSLPDWGKDALGVVAFTVALTGLALFIMVSLIPAITGGLMSAMVSLGSIFGITILPTTGLAGAFGVLAGAVWAALAPLLPFIAAAVLIGVAIYEIGKSFGWWTDVGSMIDAIRAGLVRLWEAFINNPNVQGFLKEMKQAWDDICAALQPVVDWAKQVWSELFPENSNFDIVGLIIDAFGALGDTIAFIVRAISGVQGAFNTFIAFLGYVANPVTAVVDILRTIICILLGCSPGIVPALRKTWEVFQEVFNAILGFIGGIVSPIVEAIRPLIDIFVQIVEYLIEMFLPVWNLLSDILTVIWNNVTLVIQVFEQFLTGQITLPQMLTMIWTIIQTMFVTILTMILTFVFGWAGQLISTAINAASGFVNNIITYISSLPGRFWSYLTQTTSRIISAGAQWVSSARQKATEMVNGAVTNVQQLPGKIYTEFSKVPGKIREAIPAAIQAALNFGKDIINGVLNAMGIHSPGIVQNSIADEFKNTFLRIKDAVKPAGEYAKQVGESIVDNFGTPKLSLDTEELMPYQDLDADPLENVDMDLGSLSGGLDSALGLTSDTNEGIGESYNLLAASMMMTLQDMVLQDQLAYGAIQANDIGTFNAISTSLNLNLLSMSTMLNMQLNSMLNTHRLAMANAYNTTRQQLALMLNETTKVTAEMRSAWSVMATSIINAAARIKNEATTYFNQLSTTIGTFYKKLQNPSMWGGGPGSSTVHSNRRVGYDPSVGSRITRNVANAMRVENKAPSYITGSTASRLPLAKGYREYLNLGSSSRVSVNDLIQSGAIKEEYLGLLSGVAGWGDVVPPNVKYIKDTARKWSMKGPQIPTGAGTVNTGMAFKVSEFENGTPKVSFDSFEKIARAIFTTVPYPSVMYFNTDRYGSWQNALAHGEMNCFDGANCLLALASMFGFSGYRASGTWNGIAHVFPVINGKKMDTTSMQNRGNWEGVAAGGIQIKLPRGRTTPRTTSNPLEGLFDNTGKDSSSEEVNLNLNHNVNVTIDGNTDNIDTDALIAELTAQISDKRIIDRIAEALIKRDKRIARMGGA